MAEPCIVNGVDISTCEDDFKLNELLDSCNDYETRRKIRARIKVILSDPKLCSSRVQESGSTVERGAINNRSLQSLSSFSSSASTSSSSSTSASSSPSPSSSASSLVCQNPSSAAHVVGSQPVVDSVVPHAKASVASVESFACSNATTTMPSPQTEEAANQEEKQEEFFDSGTESGEDSTKSNNTDPELNSFMENLRLSLDISKQAEIPKETTPPKNPVDETTCTPDFFKQVDIVLNRLKTSLNSALEEKSDFPPKSETNASLSNPLDQQEVLHEFIATGGLTGSQQWKVNSAQGQELISLIDRLQNSLQKLQSNEQVASEATESASNKPDSEPAGPTFKSARDKIHWQENIVKENNRPVTSSRPVWCKPVESKETPRKLFSDANKPVNPNRVLVEKQGVRGRFFHYPQLQPAPKVEPKARPKSAIITSTLLSPTESAEPADKITKASLKVQVNLNTPSGIVVKVAEKASEIKATPKNLDPPSAGTTVGTQANFNEVNESAALPSITNSENDLETNAGKRSEGPERRHLETKARDLPWKVKAAKKRAERSQTAELDGSVSVDIRKSLQVAARRKSREETEDVVVDHENTLSGKMNRSANENGSITAAIQNDERPQKCYYPILKQKSLGDLYNPKPKPFSQQLSYDPTPSFKTRSVFFVDSYNKAVDKKQDEWTINQNQGTSRLESSVQAQAEQGIRATTADNINNRTHEKDLESNLAGDQVAKNGPTNASEACKTTSEPQEDSQPAGQSRVAPLIATTRNLVVTPPPPEEGEEDIVTQSMTICKVPLRRQQAFDTVRTDEPLKIAEKTNATSRSPDKETKESSELKDPSKFLFTKSESIQIAIHKAAIKKQLSQEENKRRVEVKESKSLPVVVSPGQPVQVELRFSATKCQPETSFTAVTQDKTQERQSCNSLHTNSNQNSVIPQDNIDTSPASKPIPNSTAAEPKTCRGTDGAELGTSKVSISRPAVVREKSAEDVQQKAQEAAPKNSSVANNSEPGTEAANQNDSGLSRFARKSQNKDLMRRANTVDISATLRRNGTASWSARSTQADDSKDKPGPSFTPSKFEPKTENDKKFLAFLDRNTSSTTTTQFRPVFQKSPQSAVVPMWTNKFSNLRSSFEQKTQTSFDSPRSRRPSQEMVQDSPSVTSGNLKLQVSTGQMVITSNKIAPKQPHLLQHIEQPSPRLQPEIKSSSHGDFLKEMPKPVLKDKSEPAAASKEEPVGAIRLVLGSSGGRLIMKESTPSTLTTARGSTEMGSCVTKEIAPTAPKKPADSLPSKAPVHVPKPVLPTADKIPEAQSTTKSKYRFSCLQRSGSSFMTQSSESDKEDEEVKDVKDGEFGDDEASSSSDESSDDANTQTRPQQTSCTKAAAVQNLTKTIHKFSSLEEDLPAAACKNEASVSVAQTTEKNESKVPEISSMKEVESWNSKPSKSLRIAAFETNQLQNTPSEVTKSYYFPAQDPNPVNKPQDGIKRSFTTNFTKNPLVPNASFNDRAQQQNYLPMHSTARQGPSGTLQKSFSTTSFRQVESQVTKPAPRFPIFTSPRESTVLQKFPSNVTQCDSPKVSSIPLTEAPGPALVGLVASNIRSQLPAVSQPVVKPQESLFRRSFHEASITNESMDVSRRQRPQSLVLLPSKENSMKLESVSPRSGLRSVPMKQYEAAMSPESAEKKQQEILKYFGSLPPTPSNTTQEPVVVDKEKPSPIPSVVPKPVQRAPQPQNLPINQSRVGKKEGKREDVDFDDLISDIDDVFDALVANSDTLKRVKRLETATAAEQSPTTVVGLREASRSTESYFSSRRQAWEQSSSTKVHLNTSLQFSCQNELAKNIGNLGRTAMTRTEVVATKSSFSSSTVRQNQPISAFTKFQQLDKNVKTTPSSPQNSPLAKEGQQFRLGEGLTRSASGVKDVLLKWCQARTAGYKNVQIENFSSSWNNGLAFCALIHHFYPDAFDYDQLKPENRAYNFELAFKTAEEKAGIAPLLDVEDMVMMLRPDWKCVFTYVQSIYRRLKDD